MKRLALFALVTAWLSATTPAAHAEDDLPPIATLLREAEQAIRESESRTGEQDGYMRSEVAEARFLSGDESGATKAASEIRADITRSILFMAFLESKAKRGEFPKEVPTEFDDLVKPLAILGLARVNIAAGDLVAAHARASQVQSDRGSVRLLADFYLEMAEAHLKSEHKKGATESLEQVVAQLERLQGTTRKIEKLLMAAELSVRADALSVAEVALRLSIETNRKQLAGDRRFPSVAVDVARVGQIHALLNQNDEGDKLFRTAEEVASSLGAADREDDIPRQRAEAFAEIGDIHAAHKRGNHASRCFVQAVSYAKSISDTLSSDAKLFNVVKRKLKHRDFEGAVETVRHLKGAYWVGAAEIEFGRVKHTLGMAEDALEHFEMARQQAMRMTALNDKTAVLCDLADCLAKYQSPAAAKKVFQEAIDASDTAEDREDVIGYYQRVARAQIGARLFGDAYRTIKAMGDSQARELPTCELVRSVAQVRFEESLAKPK